MNVAGSSSSGYGSSVLRQGYRAMKARASGMTASIPARSIVSSAPAGELSEKGKRRLRDKHDAKLRHAIDLYHTASAFFPIQPTASRQTRLEMIQDKFSFDGPGASPLGEDDIHAEEPADDAEQRLLSLDEELDHSIRTGLRMTRPRSELMAGYRQSAQMVKNPVHMRTATMLMDSREQRRLSQDKYLVDDLRDESERADRTAYLSSAQASGAGSAHKETPLPAVDDAEAVKTYIAQMARHAAHEKRLTNLNVSNPHLVLDNRSARVRDALFGTVHGEYPGLEVVRERARDPRVQQEAQRLLDEAKRRRQAETEQV